jgi:hypothetical protein
VAVAVKASPSAAAAPDARTRPAAATTNGVRRRLNMDPFL